MNKSAFIFPLAGTILFLIGFVIVGAVKKPMKSPALSISIDGAEISFNPSDTLSLFETQTLSVVLRDEKMAKGTKWFLNKGFISRDTLSFVSTFDVVGQFEISLENSRFLNTSIHLVTAAAREAKLGFSFNDGKSLLVNEPISFNDSTISVKSRKWYIDNKQINSNSNQIEHTFDTPGFHKLRVRNVLTDGTIAISELSIEIKPKPVAPPARSSGGGGSVQKMTKGFFNKKRIGFDQRVSREATETLNTSQANQVIIVHDDFELAKVVLIGRSNKGDIQLRLTEEQTGNEVYNSTVKCSDGVPIQFTLPRPILRSGKEYKFQVFLSDGADIAVFDLANKTGSNYKLHDEYFTIKSSSNNHWLFDWTIYAK